ncbi:hypothetical protein H5410_040568 [Solanum commersonii]|uniref:Uncharacterized protein n=1 Tax=Solanum commersonii TaxID=4109 RepID=A0A9J5XSW9_SOLCO|nr:hypothetical protein H5410_040568 [Solanum commersonii]
MIEFWQPTTLTFQFTDFEITPTLEEISQMADLPLAGRVPLAPCTTSGIGSVIKRSMIGSNKNSSSLKLIGKGTGLLFLWWPIWIWALEQFYQRQAKNCTKVDLHNKMRSHVMRLSMWDAQNNEDSWRFYLTHLTGNHIPW